MEDPPFEDLPFELRDDNEWINNDDLWGFLRGNLSGEEYSEFERYQTQNMLRLDREKRREEFEEKVKLQRQVFEEEERDRWNKKVVKFGHKLLSKGIDVARDTTVPAYVFTKFVELPVEIQMRIWSFAARSSEPETHAIASMNKDTSEGNFLNLYEDDLKGSSRVHCETFDQPGIQRASPAALRVCKLSRNVALKVYTPLPARYELKEWPYCAAYFNTLYDSFYLGYKSWMDFKILVDIIIQLNTARPLQLGVLKDMVQLQSIRSLIVDLTIFGAAPARIWTEFSKLEKLTIAFYAHDRIEDYHQGFDMRELSFVKPQRGSKYGKRADWAVASARRVLEALKTEDMHNWTLPKIEAVVRTIGIAKDSEIEEEWTDLHISDSSDDENEDDSAWYTEAAARMIHTISKEEIRGLKHQYHPSRKVSFVDRKKYQPKRVGDWVSDSETEDAEDDRKYMWTHEDW